ncbi:hypothetical protein RBRAMI_0622 [Pseudomonas aeruginosa RB]|nr:hypothetical protein RBRAMI_0622 [Pseudomonas aeruginosa RB]
MVGNDSGHEVVMQLCIAIDTAVSEHNQLVVQIERLANRRQHYA